MSALLKVTGSAASANPQDRMMELMAGSRLHAAIRNPRSGRRRYEAGSSKRRSSSRSRLCSISPTTSEALSKGEKLNSALVNRLASRVSDLNLPRASLTAQEKNTFSFGFWTEKHIEAERKLNFRSVVDKSSVSPDRLRDARGLLTPLLRDTLVGFLYAHYAPPGAQILYTNPLFVRSHDFIGIQGSRQTWRTTEVLGSGWPSSAGGRLVGSLATLPYALAEAEQNFLIPTREQALIWGDLVPQMLVSPKLTRWWNVTPEQLHYVGLNMRLGESLLAESAFSADPAPADHGRCWTATTPTRAAFGKVADFVAAGDLSGAIRFVTPADLYNIGAQAVAQQVKSSSTIPQTVQAMAAASPDKLSAAAISEAFGTPKPTLANSLHPELLNLRLFPTLMGYSSRLMAESWESNNLYYAALADELYLSPSQLNLLVPDWTAEGTRADLCHTPGGLARAIAIPFESPATRSVSRERKSRAD